MNISPLQMIDAAAWKGLTTENHLGAIWRQSPQKGSDLIARIQQKNFGMDLENFLSRFPTKEFEDDTDYIWELQSQALDNIALIECRIDGTAITSTDKPGANFSQFELVFPKDWFSATEKIVGEENELYPIIVKDDGVPDGTNIVYTCELMASSSTDFVPYEELVAGKLFSREYAPVARTLSAKGRKIHYKSHITMRNAFTSIRIEKKTPGNLKDRKMGTAIVGPNGQNFLLWQQHESYMFDRQFREDINRLLMFGTSNRGANGEYQQKDDSGYSIVEGSGLREQAEASNTSYYNTFSIDDLSAKLMDISEGKLDMDERAFVALTGERGAYQFHKALENNAQLFSPARETITIGSTTSDFANRAMNFGGQFVEFIGPNHIKFNLSINSQYDDRNRNKKFHPDGGVTESYRYDVYDIGSTNGEANVKKVSVKGQDVIHAYIPGLRDPFSPNGSAPKLVATSVDGWEEMKYYCGGVMVMDPTKTASFIYNQS